MKEYYPKCVEEHKKAVAAASKAAEASPSALPTSASSASSSSSSAVAPASAVNAATQAADAAAAEARKQEKVALIKGYVAACEEEFTFAAMVDDFSLDLDKGLEAFEAAENQAEAAKKAQVIKEKLVASFGFEEPALTKMRRQGLDTARAKGTHL